MVPSILLRVFSRVIGCEGIGKVQENCVEAITNVAFPNVLFHLCGDYCPKLLS